MNLLRRVLRVAIVIIMVAVRNRADHYIFALWFLFSSPNLSRRRSDVCYTSTYGVALVRILDAGLKRAARGSLQNTGRKKVAKHRRLGTTHKFVGLYLCN